MNFLVFQQRVSWSKFPEISIQVFIELKELHKSQNKRYRVNVQHPLIELNISANIQNFLSALHTRCSAQSC